MTSTIPPKQYRTDWKEIYSGGSPEAEARQFATFAGRIKRVQTQIMKRDHAPFIRRAFHAKIHAGIAATSDTNGNGTIGITNAEFRIVPGVAEELRIGMFQPSATYQTTVRFSNASGGIQSDATPDLRGVALRVMTGQESYHDFLMTDAPASHARNAEQFIVAAEAMTSRWQIVSLFRLLIGLGLTETIRMVQALTKASRKIDSLETDQFWSRAPYRFGPYAVKFTLQPTGGTSTGHVPESSAMGSTLDADYLREDFIQRLLQGPITFDFRIQRYVDEEKTPIEDGTVEWKEQDSPFETLAQLVIPQQDLRSERAKVIETQVDNLEFNPWNTTEEFRPLGNLNRARRIVYQASADYRAGRTDSPARPDDTRMRSLFWIALIGVTVYAALLYLNRNHRASQLLPRGIRQ